MADSHLYLVEIKKKQGFINDKGKVVIEPSFDAAGIFSEGMAMVIQRQPEWKIGFINTKGKLVIPYQFDEASPFTEGLSAVRVGKKWGYVDLQGNLVVEPQYDRTNEFSEGLGIVRSGNEDMALDKQGKKVFAVAGRLGSCHEGLMPAEISRKWSYLDRTGNPVFSLVCSAAASFYEGMANVLQKGKMGYIDKTGAFVIQPQFAIAGNFHEGLALVQLKHKGKYDPINHPQLYVYINFKGERAFPGEFRFGREFSEGLAAVYATPQANEANYIDQQGQVVIEDIKCKDLGAADFHGGLAAIQTGGDKLGYINRKGEWVWEPQN